jgi:hypothetical protein
MTASHGLPGRFPKVTLGEPPEHAVQSMALTNGQNIEMRSSPPGHSLQSRQMDRSGSACRRHTGCHRRLVLQVRVMGGLCAWLKCRSATTAFAADPALRDTSYGRTAPDYGAALSLCARLSA